MLISPSSQLNISPGLACLFTRHCLPWWWDSHTCSPGGSQTDGRHFESHLTLEWLHPSQTKPDLTSRTAQGTEVHSYPRRLKKLTWPFLPISPRKRITMWNFILTNLNLWATQEKDSFSLTILSLAAALDNKTTLATVSLGHVCAHWIFESRRSYLVSSTDVQWQMLCLPCLCFLRPILKALSKAKEAPRKSRYRYILFILEIIWIQQLHRQPPFQNQTLSRVSGHPYKEGLW